MTAIEIDRASPGDFAAAGLVDAYVMYRWLDEARPAAGPNEA